VKPPPVRLAVAPGKSLLERYRLEGGFTDCRTAEVPRPVTLPEFIAAFYSSAVFRPERWLLGAVLGRGATAADVARLAAAECDKFAAWTVEARRVDQILLRDYQGRTRSWLMVEPLAHGTRLYFGSAVTASQSRSGSIVFRALLDFHRVYSRLLLGSAAKALLR